MRRIYRRIAHVKMAKSGLKRVNKRGADKTSFFSRHWREWV